MRALKPDLALFHAWAADRAGNVLAAAPLNENFYAAMAARRGAVVSVERVVPTDFIRRHSTLVRLPGQYVAAVVETPFGSHPGAMYGLGIPELDAYAEDLEFILELRRAFRHRETAVAWITDWMLEVPDQASYLAKLGEERIRAVKGRAHPDAWKVELAELAGGLPSDDRFTPSEMMVVAAARLLAGKVRQQGYRTFLAGVGNSNLAAWLAAYELKAAGVDVELMAETGMVGYLPRPAEPFVFSFRNFPSSKMLTDIFHVMGIFMGGSEGRCLGSLAAGQIDKHGNINSTIVPGVTLPPSSTACVLGLHEIPVAEQHRVGQRPEEERRPTTSRNALERVRPADGRRRAEQPDETGGCGCEVESGRELGRVRIGQRSRGSGSARPAIAAIARRARRGEHADGAPRPGAGRSRRPARPPPRPMTPTAPSASNCPARSTAARRRRPPRPRPAPSRRTRRGEASRSRGRLRVAGSSPKEEQPTRRPLEQERPRVEPHARGYSTTARSRGAWFSRSGPSAVATTMSSSRSPKRPGR